MCHNCEINSFNAFRFYPCKIAWEENVKKTPTTAMYVTGCYFKENLIRYLKRHSSLNEKVNLKVF